MKLKPISAFQAHAADETPVISSDAAGETQMSLMPPYG